MINFQSFGIENHNFQRVSEKRKLDLVGFSYDFTQSISSETKSSIVNKNLIINNSVNFQNLLTKFCTIVAKLFSIRPTSCEFCLKWLSFSYFIMKRAGFQFFSDKLYTHLPVFISVGPCRP